MTDKQVAGLTQLWLGNFERGCDYRVTLQCEPPHCSSASRRSIETRTAEFRTVYGKDELMWLLDKAINFVTGPVSEINVFYRNKPSHYYDKIRRSRSGVEKAYLKDMNGDRACPINRQIDGLFFSGRLKANSLPETTSPFGSTRFHISDDQLFHHRVNMYFADFYCNNRMHYVTVVITHPGSEADVFCARYLLHLDKYNNDYLCLTPNGRIFQNHCRHLRVEIFYAGDVNTKVGFFQHNITTIGRGRSTPNGLPKKDNCTICNLYPSVPTKNYVQQIAQQSRNF